jgi:ABC-type glycerol-3-phosphate transport system permease component
MALADTRTGSSFKSPGAEAIKHGLIWLALISAFFPLYVMINISAKTNQDFYAAPLRPNRPPTELLETAEANYAHAWSLVGHSIPNTIYIAVVSTALTLAAAVLAAYVFARFSFPGKALLWSALLLLMLMPSVANLVPLFVLLRDLRILNTYSALILTGAAAGQVFNVYILKNYIEDTAEDLFEAAEVDGAGPLRQIWDIVVPMNASILATLACLAFVNNWNNFLLPLLVLSDPQRLPAAVQLFYLDGAYERLWGPTMASFTIVAVPLVILFIFTMRFFIRGVAAGSVKG